MFSKSNKNISWTEYYFRLNFQFFLNLHHHHQLFQKITITSLHHPLHYPFNIITLRHHLRPLAFLNYLHYLKTHHPPMVQLIIYHYFHHPYFGLNYILHDPLPCFLLQYYFVMIVYYFIFLLLILTYFLIIDPINLSLYLQKSKQSHKQVLIIFSFIKLKKFFNYSYLNICLDHYSI